MVGLSEFWPVAPVEPKDDEIGCTCRFHRFVFDSMTFRGVAPFACSLQLKAVFVSIDNEAWPSIRKLGGALPANGASLTEFWRVLASLAPVDPRNYPPRFGRGRSRDCMQMRANGRSGISGTLIYANAVPVACGNCGTATLSVSSLVAASPMSHQLAVPSSSIAFMALIIILINN